MSDTLVVDKAQFEIPEESRIADILSAISAKNASKASACGDGATFTAYSETYAEHSNSYSVAWL